ncbi:MAG: Antibiotic biosynthesis monooxygenase [Fusobacteriaceae bacterium]|jgi:quinol monooxygenase YgiN|nr:Antibiotic biosynthesis monooxygenase [Fusobacteriaceae bacterium]
MSQKIIVLERFNLERDGIKDFKEELLKNKPLTLNEIGCENYRVFINHELPEELILLEEWETKEDYERHLESKHVIELVKKYDEFKVKNVKKEILNLIK